MHRSENRLENSLGLAKVPCWAKEKVHKKENRLGRMLESSKEPRWDWAREHLLESSMATWREKGRVHRLENRSVSRMVFELEHQLDWVSARLGGRR